MSGRCLDCGRPLVTGDYDNLCAWCWDAREEADYEWDDYGDDDFPDEEAA